MALVYDEQDYFTSVNDSSISTPDLIDTSDIGRLVFEVYFSASVKMSCNVKLSGVCFDSPHGTTYIAPKSVVGTAVTIVGAQVLLAPGDSGLVLVTYEDLPKWVRLNPGFDSMGTGTFTCCAVGFAR